MKLKDLFKNIPIQMLGDENIEINGISSHSKEVEMGDLFILKQGKSFTGIDFLPEIIHRGARALLTESLLPLCQLAQIICKSIATIELLLLHRFYRLFENAPAIFGITGTCGKTTTAFLAKKIFEYKGLPCGVIGTLGAFIGQEHLPTSLTTPSLTTSHKLLAKIKQKGFPIAVMEVSSHALTQNRIEGIDFSIGVFTNFSHEHLDYHKTLENYFEAKCGLFRSLTKEATAIFNQDDSKSSLVQRVTQAHIFTYGIESKADVRASNIQLSLTTSSFTVHFQDKRVSFSIPLVGIFNVYNTLAAVSMGLVQGLDLEEIAVSLHEFSFGFGRLESITLPRKKTPYVFVDYAHKPKALQHILTTLRQWKKNRLFIVFGCGGDRDKEKRPLMASIAEAYADLVIVTNDNPRSEDPKKIITEIITGFTQENYVIEENRYLAIKKAIALSTLEDIILIAGKGHETKQIFSNHELLFDDREVAREFLSQNF